MNPTMETVTKLKSLVLKEIDKIVEKANLTETELKNAKYALEVVEKINHIERGEEPDAEYSQRGYYVRQWDEPMGHDYYNDGNSYARGRNMRTGRYMSRDDGYSGDHDYMMHNLEMAMKEAGSEQDRRMINDLMSRMKK